MSNVSFKDKNGVITIDNTVKDIMLDTGESLINKVSSIDKKTQVITSDAADLLNDIYIAGKNYTGTLSDPCLYSKLYRLNENCQ